MSRDEQIFYLQAAEPATPRNHVRNLKVRAPGDTIQSGYSETSKEVKAILASAQQYVCVASKQRLFR